MTDWNATTFVDRAACTDAPDPELWQRGDAKSVTAAIAVCQGCPVIDECRQYALDYDLPTVLDHKVLSLRGTWGGMTENRRLQLLRRTRRFYERG